MHPYNSLNKRHSKPDLLRLPIRTSTYIANNMADRQLYNTSARHVFSLTLFYTVDSRVFYVHPYSRLFENYSIITRLCQCDVVCVYRVDAVESDAVDIVPVSSICLSHPQS